MTRLSYAWTVSRALWELVRYDAIHGALKVKRIRSRSLKSSRLAGPQGQDVEKAICDAVVLASCLYWKPVLCLQRSVCAMRLLRSHGIPARVVVGYRPVPFFSHAWVDVDGRVVNDSPVYQRRLMVLHTI